MSSLGQSILLCGASVRSHAESCMSVGLRPLCVDFFADHDLKRSLQKGRGRFVAKMNSFEDLPDLLRGIRRSVPVVWTGGLENYPHVLRSLMCDRPVIGASPDAVESVRNPLNLQLWVCPSDMQVPRIAAAPDQESSARWLRKSIRSSGGLGVHWMLPANGLSNGADERSGIAEGSKDAMRRSDYLQEYIDGVPLSATFVSGSDGVRSIGVSLQLVGWPSLGASDFLFCGNLGPVYPPAWMSRQLLAAATSVVSHSGLRGVFGLDFILKQGVLWLLEVNPRLTASHVIYDQIQTHGLQTPLIVEHLNAFGYTPARSMSQESKTVSRKALAAGNSTTEPAAGALPLMKTATSAETLQRMPGLGRVALRMILWANDDFLAPEYHSPADFARFLGLRPGTVRLRDLPAPGSRITRRSPLCSVELQAAPLCAMAEVLIAAADRTCPSPKYRWDLTANAIRDLLLQYEFHLSAPPGG